MPLHHIQEFGWNILESIAYGTGGRFTIFVNSLYDVVNMAIRKASCVGNLRVVQSPRMKLANSGCVSLRSGFHGWDIYQPNTIPLQL